MHIKGKLIAAIAVAAAIATTAPRTRADEVKKELQWEVLLAQHMDTSPAVDQNGTIYATMSGNMSFADISGGKLAALTPQGKLRWVFKTLSDTVSSPAVGGDGTVYFGCRDKNLHAVAPDGREKWNFLTRGWVDASPAIGGDETVYFGSWDANFYAVSSGGKLRWKFPAGGPVESSAAIGANGVIYFGSHDSNFYALKADGSLKWKFPTLGAIVSSPAIGEQHVIYFTSLDGRLYALDENGVEKWHLWTGGVSESSPALGPEGDIYIGVNNTFWCVTPGGKKKWDFGYPVMRGCPMIAADGAVYFVCSNDGTMSLFEFSPEGVVKGVTMVSGELKGSPAMLQDGTIITGGDRVQAWKGSAGPGRGSWWKFHGGPKQTGRVDAE